MPGLLYEDDLVLCGELEEDLRAMVGRLVEACRRRGLKVNSGKSQVMVLGREEVLECEVCISEFEYLGCVLVTSGKNETECSRKVLSWRRVADAMGYMNAHAQEFKNHSIFAKHN